jgi:Restriction endonuclease fold toxin 5
MRKFWRRQHLSWRWLIRAFISFLLVISLFSSFSYAAQDFDVKPGEIKKITTNESMKECNRLYEEQVTTGRGPNEGYVVGIEKVGRRSNGVKLDGYDEKAGILQDAKGFNYRVLKNGEWSTGKTGQGMLTSLIDRARRQKDAAVSVGKKVKWILAREKYVKAFQQAIDAAGAGDTISVEYKPYQKPPSEDAKKSCEEKDSSPDSH